MLRSTRAALAVGLGCVGVAGLVGRSVAQQQDGKVARVASAAAGAGTAAQAPVAMPALSIGTIDIEAVFKAYDKVKVAGETLNAEVMVRYNELTRMANEGKLEQEKLQRFAPGSADYKKIEDKMVQIKAQIEAGRQNAEREFTQKETEMMTSIYNEIAAMAHAVANQRGMTLVVKYNDGKIQSTEPNSAMAAMSKTIVYADPRFDITSATVGYLNQKYKVDGGPAPNNIDAASGKPSLPGSTGRPVNPSGNPGGR